MPLFRTISPGIVDNFTVTDDTEPGTVLVTQVSCDWWTGHRNAELSLVQMLWGHTTNIGCGWLQLDVGADKWRRLPGR